MLHYHWVGFVFERIWLFWHRLSNFIMEFHRIKPYVKVNPLTTWWRYRGLDLLIRNGDPHQGKFERLWCNRSSEVVLDASGKLWNYLWGKCVSVPSILSTHFMGNKIDVGDVYVYIHNMHTYPFPNLWLYAKPWIGPTNIHLHYDLFLTIEIICTCIAGVCTMAHSLIFLHDYSFVIEVPHAWCEAYIDKSVEKVEWIGPSFD